MGFDTQDLSRQAGYSEGDRVTELVAQINAQASTTSGSFTTLSDTNNKTLVDLSHIPDEATLTAQLTVQAGNTMDTDGDYRGFINAIGPDPDANTPVVTIPSGDTFSIETSGRVEVDTRGIVVLGFEFRADGTNTVSIFDGSLELQVEL